MNNYNYNHKKILDTKKLQIKNTVLYTFKSVYIFLNDFV